MDDMNDPEYAPWRAQRSGPDIFHESWGSGSQHAFNDDWLRVWRHRAAQHRAEFRRDLRRERNAFAARMAALEINA